MNEEQTISIEKSVIKPNDFSPDTRGGDVLKDTNAITTNQFQAFWVLEFWDFYIAFDCLSNASDCYPACAIACAVKFIRKLCAKFETMRKMAQSRFLFAKCIKSFFENLFNLGKSVI